MSQPTPGSPTPAGAQQRAWWGDRGVSTKILTAVAAAGVVAATVGVLGITALGTAADATQTLYEENLSGISALDDMASTVAEARKQIRDVLIDPDPASAQRTLNGMGDLLAEFAEHRAEYEAKPLVLEAVG